MPGSSDGQDIDNQDDSSALSEQKTLDPTRFFLHTKHILNCVEPAIFVLPVLTRPNPKNFGLLYHFPSLKYPARLGPKSDEQNNLERPAAPEVVTALLAKARKPLASPPSDAPSPPCRALSSTPEPRLLSKEELNKKPADSPETDKKPFDVLNSFLTTRENAKLRRLSHGTREQHYESEDDWKTRFKKLCLGPHIYVPELTNQTLHRWVKSLYLQQAIAHHKRQLDLDLVTAKQLEEPVRDTTVNALIHQFRSRTHECGLCEKDVHYSEHLDKNHKIVVDIVQMTCDDCSKTKLWTADEISFLWGIPCSELKNIACWRLPSVSKYTTDDLYEAWLKLDLSDEPLTHLAITPKLAERYKDLPELVRKIISLNKCKTDSSNNTVDLEPIDSKASTPDEPVYLLTYNKMGLELKEKSIKELKADEIKARKNFTAAPKIKPVPYDPSVARKRDEEELSRIQSAPSSKGPSQQEEKTIRCVDPFPSVPPASAKQKSALADFPISYSELIDEKEFQQISIKEGEEPWKIHEWAENKVSTHQPLHQIIGAFPHGKHHASLAAIESDIPLWVLPNMNREWAKDLNLNSPLLFTKVDGINHLTLGRPTKAGSIWVLRMTILSNNLHLQSVLSHEDAVELHTAYPVLSPLRTYPVPVRVFQIQQWRNLVEASIQMRLTPPTSRVEKTELKAVPGDSKSESKPKDISEEEQKSLQNSQQEKELEAKIQYKKDMERYLDITAFAVDYCKKQSEYHRGDIKNVYLTSIAESIVLSPTHDCDFDMLPQSSSGEHYPLAGDGTDAFEGVMHMPQTFNPLLNAEVFGRIEHVEELPGKMYGEGESAYLIVASVQGVPFEMIVSKSHVFQGKEDKQAKDFIRGQRFWAKCWLQCADASLTNVAEPMWPRAIGPYAASEVGKKVDATPVSISDHLPTGKNIAKNGTYSMLLGGPLPPLFKASSNIEEIPARIEVEKSIDSEAYYPKSSVEQVASEQTAAKLGVV